LFIRETKTERKKNQENQDRFIIDKSLAAIFFLSIQWKNLNVIALAATKGWSF
jgi:hypothetical protein